MTGVIVSNPVPAGFAKAVQKGVAQAGSGGGDVVYVSLTPGTAPTGIRATVQRVGDLTSLTTVLIGGGFDPVPVLAQSGDTIEVSVANERDSTVYHAKERVTAARPPVVVRTEPPPRKRDVPLNASMVIVFSEPVTPASVTPATVHLRLGSSDVPGTVGPLQGTATSVVFVPAAPLASNTGYRLEVSTDVHGVSGQSLDAAVTVDFTTGTATAGVPQSVDVRPFETSIAPLAHLQLQVLPMHDANGIPLVGLPITWSSGDSSVARVGSTGVVTAVAMGTTLIDANVAGINGVAQVTVLSPLTDTTTLIAYSGDRTNPNSTVGIIGNGTDVNGNSLVLGSQPSWSPDGSRFAFASDWQGSSEIYVMPYPYVGVNGWADFPRLTNDPADDHAPAWSPDGRRIAFTSDRDGSDHIYLMNTDGSGVTRVAQDASGSNSEDLAAWSPDGNRLAFIGTRNGQAGIYTMDVGGTGVRLLVSGSTSRPAWSPDGTRIAFSADTGGIFEVNPDGTRLQVLRANIDQSTPGGCSRLGCYPPQTRFVLLTDPAYSRDGTRIAVAMWNLSPGVWINGWTGVGGIGLMTANGGGLARLHYGVYGPFAYPAWRP